jgi:oligoendopeptidase F
MAKQLLRSEIPVEQTWKVEDIFATKEEWEKELAQLKTYAAVVIKNKGK